MKWNTEKGKQNKNECRKHNFFQFHEWPGFVKISYWKNRSYLRYRGIFHETEILCFRVENLFI